MSGAGIIGADAARIEAVAKVTGAARFAADMPHEGLLHAVLVGAPVARGRLLAVDAAAARAVPGLRLVLTHTEMPRLAPVGFLMAGGRAAHSFQPMQGEEIRYRGQPVALVVAESPEAARRAAALVRVEMAAEPFAVTLDAPGGERRRQPELLPALRDLAAGDAEAAFAAAEIRVDAAYTTPPQHQNPIELLSCTAAWQGEALTIEEPTQFADGVRFGVAQQLGLDPARVRVVSPLIGGGFGLKNALMPFTAPVAVAARRLGAPVRLVLTRAQCFEIGSFRTATRQRVRLGATRDGRITAAIHEATSQTSRADAMPAVGSHVTARMYGIPNVRAEEWLVRLDTQTPGYMRAPMEFAHGFSFESAMDELAVALGEDPVALRLRHDTDRDPITGKPFSSRHLAACLRRGAEIFGWARRDPRPGAMRDPASGALIGWGVACGAYKAAAAPGAARVRLEPGGRAQVAVGGHEMGQGLRTAVALVVADALGLAPEAVAVETGDTALGPQHLTAGSWGTAASCPAARQAAEAARDALLALAAAGPLAGHAPGALRLAAGRVEAPDGRAATIAAVLAAAGREAVTGEASLVPSGLPEAARGRAASGLPTAVGPEFPDFVAMSYGAQFVEVRVDPLTRGVRVTRAVGVFDCGRVLSRRTARSQALGGLVWGIGSALHDASEPDTRRGGFGNASLGDYLLPVNADIRGLTVDFVDAPDPLLNRLGAKGLGEVTMVGTAAAVANAVFHATGQRLRDLPIRFESLLPA